MTFATTRFDPSFSSPGVRPCVLSKRRPGSSARAYAYDPGSDTIEGWDKLTVEEIDKWEERGPSTPLLDTVNYPVHMKNFTNDQVRCRLSDDRLELLMLL